MTQTVTSTVQAFQDRRKLCSEGPPTLERRQFANSHSGFTPEAQELARAIDEYKLHHRRRFITYEEILNVMKSLGYHKTESGAV